MTDTPRYRAEVTGHFVQFFSRDTKIATVRWHSRFKCEYRTLRDARAAKAKYEASGKILWPDDLRITEEKLETNARMGVSRSCGFDYHPQIILYQGSRSVNWPLS